MLEQFSNRIGGSIPFACQDWANTKAAYRLLSSDLITENAILAGHLAATRSRSSGGYGPLLILRDTTTFTYNRGDMAAVGITHRSFTRTNHLNGTDFPCPSPYQTSSPRTYSGDQSRLAG